MRIFRIYPQIRYSLNERFTLTQNVEVLANYVDYDFETGMSSAEIRSYVFRRFAIAHQLSVDVSRHSELFVDYKFEIEENGKLNWDEWTEILLMSRRNHWLRLNLKYKFYEKFSISPGIIFFKRVESKQNSTSLATSLAGQAGDMLSYGPTLTIKYVVNEKMNFIFDGMRRVIERGGFERSYINFINLKLSWYH
jgi:hypothetical protein